MEAEESLAEKEQVKRKQEDPGEKMNKRRKFCLLESWGEPSIQQEEQDHPDQDLYETGTASKDWLEEVETKRIVEMSTTQSDLTSWLGEESITKEEVIPEVQIKENPGEKKRKTDKEGGEGDEEMASRHKISAG